MIPDEVYARSSSSSKFKYSHPLNNRPVDDGAMRARLAYDLMAFMNRSDCAYFMNPDSLESYSPEDSDDEIDILIVDGYYKEAAILLKSRLTADPENDKLLFQKAFIQHLQHEYQRLLERENQVLRHDPQNVNALINKGFALANLNREEEALMIADKALQIDPDNMIALSNKAYIAKSLGRDELREKTLMKAYNVSARQRLELLERQEAKLLRDFGSNFVEMEMPSAFAEFNLRSGVNSTAIH
jgi:tetratricopeptide (TPR) repeat protein